MAKAHGLRFSESLSGYLSEGDDYWAACEVGRAQGLRARFQVTVSIPDLDAFLVDPEHVASLQGNVAVAGLGEALDVRDGRLHLFCRREGETRLLYYLPFDLEGRRLLLWGEKRLTGAKSLGAWREMTTLYAELRQGGGQDTVLRRGVLRIGLAGVLGQAASFRPVGASSPRRFLVDWARFLGFSSRQIWAA